MHATPHNPLSDFARLPHVQAEITYGALVDGVQRYRYDTMDRSRTNLVLEKRSMEIYDVRSLRDELSYQVTPHGSLPRVLRLSATGHLTPAVRRRRGGRFRNRLADDRYEVTGSIWASARTVVMLPSQPPHMTGVYWSLGLVETG